MKDTNVFCLSVRSDLRMAFAENRRCGSLEMTMCVAVGLSAMARYSLVIRDSHIDLYPYTVAANLVILYVTWIGFIGSLVSGNERAFFVF